MKMTITYLPGDGIGPEVGNAACHVLNTVCERFGHVIEMSEHLVGGAAIDATGTPLPDETRAAVRESRAVLLGAVGGPKWDGAPLRPERGLLELRRELDVFANLRPVVPHPWAHSASPVKSEILKGVDILVVRELTGGIYFGDKQRTEDAASDLSSYSREEIARVVRKAAQFARERRGLLTSVDKANVLETGRLWREVTTDIVGREFPDVELEHLLVDAAAMHLISRPREFDVIVTENMFGDILTDEASMLAGSMGLLPSASLGSGGPGLFEPIHGSAPDIAGKGVANPFGMILSAALMLRHAFHLDAEADTVETAVWSCLDAGLATGDLGGTLSTHEAAETVAAAINRPFLKVVGAI